MNVEVLLTEAEIDEEFADSLAARDIPEKFFFWTPLSVRAWGELASASHQILLQTWQALAARAAELTRSIGNRVPVISFGAGNGARDRLMLKGLHAAGREVKYFPVDASQMMLEAACAGAEDDDCEALGIKADISSPMHLLLAADVSEPPRLFFMVGNTLAGFDPLEQIKHVVECLQKGDILVVDARIRNETVWEPSPAQKRFVFSPLESVGIRPEDGELKFEEKRDERRDGLYLLTRRFQTSRDLTLNVSGREIRIERGERIFLNFRYHFTRESFRWLLSDYGCLNIGAEIPSADDRFVTAICTK